jgi:hypothetical protein
MTTAMITIITMNVAMVATVSIIMNTTKSDAS